MSYIPLPWLLRYRFWRGYFFSPLPQPLSSTIPPTEPWLLVSVRTQLRLRLLGCIVCGGTWNGAGTISGFVIELEEFSPARTFLSSDGESSLSSMTIPLSSRTWWVFGGCWLSGNRLPFRALSSNELLFTWVSLLGALSFNGRLSFRSWYSVHCHSQ